MKNKKYLIVAGIVVLGIFLFAQKGKHQELKVDDTIKLLSSFEDKKQWDISPERGFAIRKSRKNVTDGKYSLEVKFPKWNLPSINTKKLEGDWSEYDSLAIDIYSPSKDRIPFKIRIDDKNKKRIKTSYKLVKGLNRIVVPMEKIRSKIDASQVSFVVMYLEEPGKRYKLYFDNMRLERTNLRTDFTQGSSPELQLTDSSLSGKYDLSYVNKGVVAKKGSLKIAFAKIKKDKNPVVLLSSGVPFAPGQLNSIKNFAIFDLQGKEIPIAVQELARWPMDQSIRSVLVQFKQPIEYIFEYGELRWGVKRKTKDLKIVKPIWKFSEGIIVMPAAWLCQSQVTGEQVPFGKSASGDYDRNIEENYPELLKRPKTGNIRLDGYYSTAHVYYQIYARTGEIKYFLQARKELLHYREYEIQHEGKYKGAGVIAQNVGRYVYMQAMMDDYLLTGDPRTLEVAGEMAEFLRTKFPPIKAFYRKGAKNFWTERFHAFPFLGVLTYYELTQDKKYLKAADAFMTNLHRMQLQWPDRGGFIHNLYAHDPEEGARPDEYGGSPFMTGILLEPIIKYHKLTGSKIAADSIFLALDWLIKEGIASNGNTVKYMTSDKYLNSSGDPDVNLLVVHGFGYGYRLSGYKNQEYLNVGQKLFDRGVKDAFLKRQKQFNQNYRSSGHYLAYIQGGIQQSNQKAPIGILEKREKELLEKSDEGVNKNILVFENFEDRMNTFGILQGTQKSYDSDKRYLNGKSLKISSRQSGALLSAGVLFDDARWDIKNFGKLSFAYLIPEGSVVGMKVKTQYDDWICLGGSTAFKCDGPSVKRLVQLIDDGQWHEFSLNVKDLMKKTLPGVERLKGFLFYNNSDVQRKLDFWVDEFKIKR